MMKNINEGENLKVEIYFLKHYWIVVNQLLEDSIPDVRQENIKVSIKLIRVSQKN